jgi:hypothetical protein
VHGVPGRACRAGGRFIGRLALDWPDVTTTTVCDRTKPLPRNDLGPRGSPPMRVHLGLTFTPWVFLPTQQAETFSGMGLELSR